MSLLIIKTDAIGDYVLFRNFIEVLKKSEKFNGYKIDLLGNVLWKDFALEFDSKFINSFYFTDTNNLYYAPLKTFALGWKLFKNNYGIVLQPSFTRSLITDGLAALTASKQIYGFESDLEGIPPRYKKKTDKFYTSKLPLPQNCKFEFQRSRLFFETILSERSTLNGPNIKIDTKFKTGIVIFPGAGDVKRRWPFEKFEALAKLIIANSTQPIYFAGSKHEFELCNNLVKSLSHPRVYNIAGKTTLSQLVELIGNALFVISNETSATHIAAATKTKSICVLGGGHFGRFTPYPFYIENRPICVYEKMECFNCNWRCKFFTDNNGAYPCVSAVGLESVWFETKKLLS